MPNHKGTKKMNRCDDRCIVNDVPVVAPWKRGKRAGRCYDQGRLFFYRTGTDHPVNRRAADMGTMENRVEKTMVAAARSVSLFSWEERT